MLSDIKRLAEFLLSALYLSLKALGCRHVLVLTSGAGVSPYSKHFIYFDLKHGSLIFEISLKKQGFLSVCSENFINFV